jgi:hypothetical protein
MTPPPAALARLNPLLKMLDSTMKRIGVFCCGTAGCPTERLGSGRPDFSYCGSLAGYVEPITIRVGGWSNRPQKFVGDRRELRFLLFLHG